MQQLATGLFADLTCTFRAAIESSPTNWRAHWAFHFLIFGVGFGLAGVWLVFRGAMMLHTALFLLPSCCLLFGWRFYLEKALWYWRVEKTLEVARRPSRVAVWLSGLVNAVLVLVVVGACLGEIGQLAV